jgi:hypothetical protein
MSASQFKEAFAERCLNATAVGSHIGIRELIAWTHDLIRQTVQTLDQEEIKAFVLEQYDKYVAPYDLPYIPNLIEPRVDAALRAALGVGIDRLFEALAS